MESDLVQLMIRSKSTREDQRYCNVSPDAGIRGLKFGGDLTPDSFTNGRSCTGELRQRWTGYLARELMLI
ncbi:hypothetical protein H6P81_015264 [Aristolochia fimbriata]|uniref:Uncharacterized protein n=1 Tax=Aristolochia fimbriata TaxID=158543 RepID=A0AAV7E5P1_ARIFI|nr:hypothetical protein H6P81_015264 [Aristolochia fimbriata]